MDAKSKKTKLTLTVREDIIRQVKQQAKERGISVSKLFEEKVDEIIMSKEEKIKALNKLRDLIKQSAPSEVLPESDRELYHKHLAKKYG